MPLAKITRKFLAKQVSKRWHQTYFKNNTWMYNSYGTDRASVYDELVYLGENPHPDDVDRVIGNPTWTQIVCDNCGVSVEEACDIGEKRNYESSTARVCVQCLKNALTLMDDISGG